MFNYLAKVLFYARVTFTFTFMHLADAFIQSDLHCIQVTVSTFYQLLLSLGIEPMILASLTPCSTSWATGKLNVDSSWSWVECIQSTECHRRPINRAHNQQLIPNDTSTAHVSHLRSSDRAQRHKVISQRSLSEDRTWLRIWALPPSWEYPDWTEVVFPKDLNI